MVVNKYLLKTQGQHSHVDGKLLSEMFTTWNIMDAFAKGKADHYYTLTIRNIFIAFLGCGCFGLIFYIPALLRAKLVCKILH